MRLTVLGSSASYAGPGQACAGYLVEGEGATLLMDCGNGVVSNLGAVADPLALDGVFVTHLHPDHFADLFALQALLRYAPQGPAPALPLFGPPGLLGRLQSALDEKGAREMAEAFDFSELEAGETVVVGDLAVTPSPVDHIPDTLGLVVEQGPARMFYTSDTRLSEDVRAAAMAAGLLLAEATMPPGYEGRAPHMTAGEAGRLAMEAGVGLLLLTHLWPTTDRERARRDAEEVFRGPVMIAEEMLTVEVG